MTTTEPRDDASIAEWQRWCTEIEAAAPTPPACPPWCEQQGSERHGKYHAPGYDENDTYTRAHLRSFGAVCVEQEERNTRGAVTLLPPLVSIDGCRVECMDAEKAQRTLDDLASALGMLNQITGATA